MKLRSPRSVCIGSRSARFVGSVCLCLLLSGCAIDSKRGALASFGDRVLSGAGLEPGKSHYRGDQGVENEVANFTREEEYYLGRAVAARIAAKYQVINNEQAAAYLNSLGMAMSLYSGEPVTFGGFHFVILDTDALNAVSAPGGFIFISRGLIEALPDEDALAAVIAHEITHVTAHHGVRSLSRENHKGALTAAGVVAGALSCDMVLAEAAAVLGASVDEIFDALFEKGYSREFEFEADNGSLEILKKSGLSSDSLKAVFASLDKSAGSAGGGGWFSTHPSTSERGAALPAAGFQASPNATSHEQNRLKRFRQFQALLRSKASAVG